MKREALEQDTTGDLGFFSEMHLTGSSRACLQNILTMLLEPMLINRRDKSLERLSYQLVPIRAEQRRGPQIGLQNLPVRIQREMADRGKIVEFHIAVTGCFAFQLSPAELVASGITPGLLRVSVGLEDLEDLREDLARGLAAATVAVEPASTGATAGPVGTSA